MVYVGAGGDLNKPKAGRGETLKLRPCDGRNRKAQSPDSLPFSGCALCLPTSLLLQAEEILLFLAISFQTLPPPWD